MTGRIYKQFLEKKDIFSKIQINKIVLDDNKADIVIDIDLGEKSKIKKITFLGDKKFKSKKLLSIIISEEFKFWKIISQKKYLNEELIDLDKRLLKSFYLNKGFYNAKINTSFARLINLNEFELIFKIDSGSKVFFGNLDLNLPTAYDQKNLEKIYKKLKDVEGSAYSVNKIEEILDEIDQIVLSEQYNRLAHQLMKIYREII